MRKLWLAMMGVAACEGRMACEHRGKASYTWCEVEHICVDPEVPCPSTVDDAETCEQLNGYGSTQTQGQVWRFNEETLACEDVSQA